MPATTSVFRYFGVVLSLSMTAACSTKPSEADLKPREAQVSEAAVEGSTSPSSAGAEAQRAEAQRRAQSAAQAFATELKSTLLAAMQAGGPESAVDVCASEAPEIAARVGRAHGVHIGRVAVEGKQRRATNAPSGWQFEGLRPMEEAVWEGAKASEQVFVQSEGLPEGVAFRMMKGIETEGVCVTCHGSEISDSVLRAIQAAYPNDRATGFNVGDLRGALWVEVPSP